MFQKQAGALAVILDWGPLERNPGLVDCTCTRQVSGLSFPAREGRQVSGLSFPEREGTFMDEKVLRAHRSSDKKMGPK